MTRSVVCIGVAWFLAILPTPLLAGLSGFFFFNGYFATFVWVPVALTIAIALVLHVIFSRLTRVLSKPAPPVDTETRCRRCGYILRGITEPRCSECGERI